MRLIPAIEPRYRVLFVPMFLCFTLFGLNLTIIGAALPKILREFHWSDTVTGLVLSASSASYFLSTFVCGVFIRRLGPKAVIVGGLLIQAVGLSLFGATDSAPIGILLQFIIGCGGGATEVVINFACVRMESNGQSRLMNLMHAAFAVGAVLCPLGVGSLVAAGSHWQVMFRVMAAASAGIGLVMALLPFSRLNVSAAEHAEQPSVGQMLRHPLLVVCSLALLVYVGAELGVSNWVAEYFVRTLQAPDWLGSYMVAVFWLGLLIGRAGVSALYHGRRLAELLLILVSVATVALLAAVVVHNPWTAAVGFFCTGLGFSAIYPLVMSLLGQHFPRGQSVAVGVAGTGGGIGAFVFPFIMAAISDRFGISRGFYFYVTLNVVMAGLLVAAAAIIRRKGSPGIVAAG